MATITITQQKTLTQEQLENYKSLFPNDERIQAVTLEELIKNTNGKVDWSNLPLSKEVGNIPSMADDFSCIEAVGFVVFDALCLALGGVGLRADLSGDVAEAVGNAAKPSLSAIETIIADITAESATITDVAWGVYKILKTIYSAGCLGAVIDAFLTSLSYWQKILYGATALGTIVAAVATDGVAFVGEIVIELATFGFLVDDSIKAVEACNLTT